MRCSVRFFAIALFVFLNFAFLQNSFAQVLKADYQFQNTRSSSVGGAPGLADLIRLAQSCPSYCNTFTTDTVKGESRRVLQFPTDNGLNLQPTTSVLSNNGIYSIAILFKFDTGDTWRRIVEFKNGTGDNGLYVSPTNVLNFFNAPPNGTTAILPGTYYQVVLTRDGSGNLMVYVDGVLQFQFSDSGNDGVMDGNNSLRFFQDNTVSGVTGEASSGAVARIRVFDGALTAGQVGALDCVPAPPGMVAWWPGDGNANDIRGENNGTLQPPSNGTGFAPGEVGHAFTFDGIDDFVSVASTPALDFGTRDFTIDLWVNLNSLTGNQTFFDKTVPGFPNSQTYLVEFNAPDKLRFLVRNTTSNELSLLATVSLQTGTWYHVAAVRQGNTSTIYLDGTQVAQQSSVGPIDTGAGGVATIGRLSETSVRFMSGQIDELEIFSRALAIGEIKGIFNAGSAGKCKPRCTPPPSGMVSWYTGDDNPFDIFGTNHGTLQGGATFADGKAGRAFSLNGTDAFIQVPNNPGLDPTAAGSLDAWVKFNQLPSAANHVMEIVGTGNSGNDFDLQANTNDRFLFSVEDGATATSTTVIQTGVWYHVAGTWDSNSIIIYVNGVLEETNSSSVTRSPGGEQLEIGHKFGSENAFFNGLIDEVEVFDRALSTTEIQAINNAASAGKCKLCLSPPDNLVGWWTGDANARDDSGIGNNGSLQGGAAFAIGKVGQAFNLDGTNDYVRIGDDPALRPTSVTLDAWFNFSTSTPGTRAMLSKAFGAGTTDSYQIFYESGQLQAMIGDAGGEGPRLQFPFIPVAGRWYHIAFTFNDAADSEALYLDGTMVASAAVTKPIGYDSHPFLIGADTENGVEGAFSFPGQIDEVEVFNRALTQTELQSIVAAGASGKCKRGATTTGANSGNQLGDATIIFRDVSSGGTTTYQTLPLYQAGPMPFGYNSPLHIADISTTAIFSGGVRACFNLQAVSDNNTFNQLRVLHLEGNDLVNRTSSADFATRTLCANVASLSPFVITQGPNLPTAAPATISGRITTTEGVPLAGVTINLGGARSARTVTDGNGNYRFNNIDTDNFYTLRPSLVNYHFSPVERSFSLIANRSDAVFTANPDSVIVGNAIDSAEFFVRQHYVDFLEREPDEAGFNFWSDQIRSCGTDASCLEVKRINVSAAYFLSIEFQRTGGLVDGLYRATYGRRPFFAEFTPDTAQLARSVVVGNGDWEQQLATNKQAFVADWVERPAFKDVYNSLSNGAYVDALIAHTGISFRQSERDELVSGLARNTLTRAAVLLRIAEDGRFVNAKRNEAFVMMEYFGYLRRDPDESGYQFWLNKLNQFGGDFQRAEMVKAFINSGEYRMRFAR